MEHARVAEREGAVNFVAPHMTPPKGARDGQLIDGASLPVRLANFVKLPHTVFAMPFALVGLIWGAHASIRSNGSTIWTYHRKWPDAKPVDFRVAEISAC